MFLGEGLAGKQNPSDRAQVSRLEVAAKRELDKGGGYRVPHRDALLLEKRRQAARHHQHRRRQDDGRRARSSGAVVVEGGKAGVMRGVVAQAVVAGQGVLSHRPLDEAHGTAVGVKDELRNPGGARGVQDVGRIEIDHRHIRRPVAGFL